MPLRLLHRVKGPIRPRYFLIALCLTATACAGNAGSSSGTIPSVTPQGQSTFSTTAANATTTAAAQWQETFHDGGHTNFNPSESILSTSNVATLGLTAGATPAGGAEAMALSNGKLFVVAPGSSSGNMLYAYNATTLSPLWSTTTGSGIFEPTVSAGNGVVVAPCGLGTPGDSYSGVCGYSASTGHQIWSFAEACKCVPESGLATPPTYSKGVVYFAYQNGNEGYSADLVSLNASTGSVIAAHQVSNGPNYIWSDAPAVGGGSVYYSCYNAVCAFNATSDALEWTAPTGSTQNALTVSGTTVFDHYTGGPSGNQTGVLALSASSGSVLRSYPYCPQGCRNGTFPVAVAKSMVYATSPDGNLYAFHEFGKPAWSVSNGGFDGSPSIANGVVYVAGTGANTAILYAYNATTGAFLWKSTYQNAQNGGIPGAAPPIVANGTVYAVGYTCGNVCSFNAK